FLLLVFFLLLFAHAPSSHFSSPDATPPASLSLREQLARPFEPFALREILQNPEREANAPGRDVSVSQSGGWAMPDVSDPPLSAAAKKTIYVGGGGAHLELADAQSSCGFVF